MLNSFRQWSILRKIRPPSARGKGSEYQPMSFGMKNMKRGKRKAGKCEGKNKKAENRENTK
jgi:hypothetical protein